MCRAGTAQNLKRLATGWTVRGSNPGGSEIFRTRPHRPWGPPTLLYNGHRVSFPGVQRPGRRVNHPPPSSAEVKERVELYLYSPPGPSWPVLGRTLPCTLYLWRYACEMLTTKTTESTKSPDSSDLAAVYLVLVRGRGAFLMVTQ
jgi:hypothetical protein